MNTVLILLAAVGLILFLIWAWCMAVIASPADERERQADDASQEEFIREYMAKRLAKTKP